MKSLLLVLLLFVSGCSGPIFLDGKEVFCEEELGGAFVPASGRYSCAIPSSDGSFFYADIVEIGGEYYFEEAKR